MNNLSSDLNNSNNTNENNETYLTFFLNTFSSFKFTFLIIISLILILISGTIIPQQKDNIFYLNTFGKFSNLIFIFSLDDIYHSFIFYFIVALFCLNLIACSINQIIFKLQSFKKQNLNEINFKEIIKFIGVQFSHFSILIIIIGGITSNIYGYNILVEAKINENIDVFTPKYFFLYNKLKKILKLNEITNNKNLSDNIMILMNKLEDLKVNKKDKLFSFYLNNFKTIYSEKSEIKNWLVNLVVNDSNNNFTSEILINSPLNYKGIKIYLSSFEKINELQKIELDLKFNDEVNQNLNDVITFYKINDEYQSKDKNIKIKLLSFMYNFPFNEYLNEEMIKILENKLANSSAIHLKIEVLNQNITKNLWFFEALPEFNTNILKSYNLNFNLKFKNIETAENTICYLKIVYEPGLVLIWLGLFLLTIGLFLALGVSTKKQYINI